MADDAEAKPTSPAIRSHGPIEIFARFSTAASALVFAEQTLGTRLIRDTFCLHGDASPAWWIRRELTLDAAREAVSVSSGQVYLRSGEALMRDRGWGSAAGVGSPVTLSALRPVAITEVVRAAGLHPVPRPQLKAAVLLMPGRLVSSIVRRALDLQLTTTYRRVTLCPLFAGDAISEAGYAVRLSSGRDLPRSLLVALERNPAVLVCREAGESLLIQWGRAAGLSDWSLLSLTDGDRCWVLADPEYGCARLDGSERASDGACLVEPAEQHRLDNVVPDAAWTDPAESLGPPKASTLTLVPAPVRGAPVDAVLLSDADLSCLQYLLAGEPIAETAILVPGRDRHLLTAPGGLLEELPVGEPLSCIGPGSLYIPLGYRIEPLLPASAREALFPTGPTTAVVLLRDSVLAFDLAKRCPAWRVWAGPAPDVDVQLPESAVAELSAIEAEFDLAQSEQPSRHRLRLLDRRSSQSADNWQRQAYEAELARDWVTAARILAEHNQPAQAARLYERAAEES